MGCRPGLYLTNRPSAKYTLPPYDAEPVGAKHRQLLRATLRLPSMRLACSAAASGHLVVIVFSYVLYACH